MKKPIFFFFLLSGCCLILASCSKSNHGAPSAGPIPSPPPKIDSSTYVSVNSLVGKWSIADDTLSNANNYFFTEGGDSYYPPAVNYHGGPNDYLTFNSDGTYNGSENGVVSAGNYLLQANQGISISSRPPLTFGRVVTLTADSLTIVGEATSLNGGTAIETLYLKK
jgi:hypothetical protein